MQTAPKTQYEPVFTPTEVAAIFKLSPAAVRQLIQKKELQAMRIGKQFRILKSTVDHYFNPLSKYRGPKEVKPLLKELKSGLKKLYGPRLKGVYLYGSYARSEANSESDLDILIVLDKVDHYHKEIQQTGFLISPLSIKYGTTISRVFISKKDWHKSSTPFLTNVREDAMAA